MPKPADAIMGHRKRKPQSVPPSTPLVGRKPHESWLPVTVAAWEAYWASDMARVVLDVDAPAIRRLFDLYDQHARSMDVVRMALVVKGSTGQIRTNPLADHVMKLEGVILRLENEFGLTPTARQRLGIRITGAEQAAPAAVDNGPGHYGHLRVINDG
jgi:P27 family predicted phage terminase small subunit